MAKLAAGILLYRRGPDDLEVLLAHPGGPLWSHKDDAAWTVPKGEPDPGEDLLHAAEREFREETGRALPPGKRLSLGHVRQASGKKVHVWAVEGDLDPSTCASNTCTIEWPPGSGRSLEIPEIDKVAWFPVELARRKLVVAQAVLPDRLVAALEGHAGNGEVVSG
jgi:predicted NUDIX family NTP pyrophosphohydrolase